jgi:hypothetical protein
MAKKDCASVKEDIASTSPKAEWTSNAHQSADEPYTTASQKSANAEKKPQGLGLI